jgi:hypothetical protein
MQVETAARVRLLHEFAMLGKLSLTLLRIADEPGDRRDVRCAAAIIGANK